MKINIFVSLDKRVKKYLDIFLIFNYTGQQLNKSKRGGKKCNLKK